MSELNTSYMGIPLANPVVIAASTLSADLNTIKKAEDVGAGALVIRSIFEEQIRHEVGEMEDALSTGSEAYAEALSYLPMLEHAGAREHLMWVEKAREAVKMPLIGSVNAVSGGKWVDYAKQLADTGIDALELNTYAVEADMTRSSADVEHGLYQMFEAVSDAIDLPIAVKLSPFYSSISNVVAELESRGAKGVVLFNRFLQPDINVETEQIENSMNWSRREDARLPLRWTALLYGRVNLDIIGNTGIEEPEDIIKFILAGATAVQVAGSLYRKGIDHVAQLIAGLESWMVAKGYNDLSAFRGKVSQKDVEANLLNYERAQYVGFILSQKA
ncbi:MAG: dihydroorotate dehydrogenase-like protein [Kiritimatiellae bacterium]|nr:dihydroorotate dehydrogenase-like protein [Kiritimatiellia bacterium]